MCSQLLSLTLCDPMDSSPAASSVHGIFQARMLEWVFISSSRGIFPTQGLNPHLLHLLHWQADSSPLSHQESPVETEWLYQNNNWKKLLSLRRENLEAGVGRLLSLPNCLKKLFSPS